MTIDHAHLYAVLGLSPDASQAEVRRAYRALMRQHHPDTRSSWVPGGDGAGDAAGDAGATAGLQQVLAAYAVLGDPVRRADYDKRAAAGPGGAQIRVRHVSRVSVEGEQEPPIRAGPVRWHRGAAADVVET